MVGGGISELEDINKLLRAGADKVSINTAAVLNPKLIAEAVSAFGSQCIVVAVDAKKSPQLGWEVFTHGGKRATGLAAVSWISKLCDMGAGEVLLTSMDQDGRQSGFDIGLTRQVSNIIDVPLIASGGVGTMDHLVQGILEGKADAVLAASIFHFGRYSIKEVKKHMHQAGITMRLT